MLRTNGSLIGVDEGRHSVLDERLLLRLYWLVVGVVAGGGSRRRLRRVVRARGRGRNGGRGLRDVLLGQVCGGWLILRLILIWRLVERLLLQLWL